MYGGRESVVPASPEAQEVAWLKQQFESTEGRRRGEATDVAPGAKVSGSFEDAMARLRRSAINKQLDMTDALSEFAHGGDRRDYVVGIMNKSRFTSAMGYLFEGEVSVELQEAICARYAAGGWQAARDSSEVGGYAKVKWKQAPPRLPSVSPHTHRHTHHSHHTPHATTPSLRGATGIMPVATAVCHRL